MRLRKSGSSRKPGRLLSLEPLENRCVPAAGGLLGNLDLGSLLSAPSANVNPSAASTTTNAVASTSSDHPGLRVGLLDQVVAPHGQDKGNPHADSKGGLVDSLGSSATDTLSGVVNLVGGTVEDLTQAVSGQPTQPVLPVGSGSKSGTPGAGTGLGNGGVDELLDGTGDPIPVSVVLVVISPAAGVVPGTNSFVAGSSVQPGSNGNALLVSVLSNGSQGAGAGNAGLAPNQNLFTGTSLAFTQGAPSSALPLVNAPLAGSNSFLGQSGQSPLMSGPGWGLALAGGGIARGAGLIEAGDVAIQEHQAEMARSQQEPGTLEAQPAEYVTPAPVSAGLLNASDDLRALDAVFRDFLEGLSDLRLTMGNWLVRLGPAPWIGMGLAVTAVVSGEVARRARDKRQATRDKRQKLPALASGL